MTRLWLTAALWAACGVAGAEPVLSCDEIDEVGEGLMAIGIALEDDGLEVGVGSDVEHDLAQVTMGLAQIAEAEGDPDLAQASIGMADAWDAMDKDAFTDALADAVAKLAVISASECE